MFGKLTKGIKAWRLLMRLDSLIENWGKNVPQNDNQTVVVGVKSAWLSKVNWTAAAGFFVAVFDFLSKSLSATDQAAIVDLIKNSKTWPDIAIAGLSIATIIVRTWFTKHVTVSVAKKNGNGAAIP